MFRYAPERQITETILSSVPEGRLHSQGICFGLHTRIACIYSAMFRNEDEGRKLLVIYSRNVR